jgi:GNAT superfamily N-acetyltransferase
LEVAGFRSFDGGMPGMAMATAEIDEKLASPAGVVVERAKTEPEIAQWAETFVAAHGFPAASADAWIGAARRLRFRQLPWQHWVARIEGEPVGVGLSFLGGGVIGLYGIGTLPAARRRGVGSALTLVPMLEARDGGYRGAILHATPDGEHLYPRIGFREYCRISRFLGGI